MQKYPRRRQPSLPKYLEHFEPRHLLSTFYALGSTGSDNNPGHPRPALRHHPTPPHPTPSRRHHERPPWHLHRLQRRQLHQRHRRQPHHHPGQPWFRPRLRHHLLPQCRHRRRHQPRRLQLHHHPAASTSTTPAATSPRQAGIRIVTDTNVLITNNTTDHNGTWGIFTGFAQNITIQNNTCSNSQTQHGIYVSNSADNPIIRGNNCFGNDDCGIQLNSDASQGGDGIISNALIAGNIVHDNGVGGGSAINLDGVQNSRIQNNLLYNNHSSGISLYKIDAAQPAINNLIINNTIIMAADARWAINITSASTGNTVYNNILLNNSSHGAINITADSLTGFTSDFNAVKNLFSPDDGNTFQTLAQWRTTTGQDAHSIIATAAQLFVNATGNDYHLSATSLALNAGTTPRPTSAPAYDLENNPRPSGTGFDIGAYERQVPGIIAGRFLFYNNSAFDTVSDSAAIATNKSALLPAQVASFANYSSYSRGINGLFIDISGAVNSLTAADFSFTAGNTSFSFFSAPAPAPQSITFQPGAGVNGSTRITLIWPDNAIQQTWLQVTSPFNNSHTSLAVPDIFYFGNAIADSGVIPPTDAKVNATDQLAPASPPPKPPPSPATPTTTATASSTPSDQTLARNNFTWFLNQLNLIQTPIPRRLLPQLSRASPRPRTRPKHAVAYHPHRHNKNHHPHKTKPAAPPQTLIASPVARRGNARQNVVHGGRPRQWRV